MTPINMMPEQELRDKADQCELDLIQAGELAPHGERYNECFAALYCLCVEMVRRGMTFKPKEAVQ